MAGKLKKEKQKVYLSPGNLKRKMIPRIFFMPYLGINVIALTGIPVYASDIFATAKNAMQTVYTDVAGIATVAAVVCAAVCLFLMNFSKSGRTVDESRSWLKRIVVCWAALMTLAILLFTYFLETFQVAYAQKAENLPQIVSWQDGKGYQSDGTFIADGWGYDTVNPAGKYVLFDENGMVQLRTETMDPVNAEDEYSGTELEPANIAVRAEIFERFTGKVHVTIEENGGVQREIDLDSSVFFEWNLSVNSGNYRLKSVEATQNDQKYVAEFDNNYKNLPEQGLIIMKIKVKNELVEAVQTEKKQNKTDQQNNIQNPEKSDSGIKNTEVVTTVKKTGQKTGIIIGGLSFLGAVMWLLYRKFHRKK